MKDIVAIALLALSSIALAAPSPKRLPPSPRLLKRSSHQVSEVSRRSAAPSRKRADGSTVTDADILNYALTLEHLEDTFYRQGLANFSQAAFTAAGYDATFRANIAHISADESTHVAFLTGALSAAGATPVAACTYAFGVTDVKSFIATASILEGVGVSAYLGAAAAIANKAYLTAAGSILTVEARHNAYIRADGLEEVPFPQPFDAPLTLDDVYSLAAPFFVSCPSTNPALPVKAFPGISVTTAGPYSSGQTVNLQTNKYVLAPADSNAKLYAAFAAVTGPVFATLTPAGDGQNFQLTIPSGVYGQSYVVLTNCNTTVTDATTVAGPAIIEIATPAAS